MTVGPGFYSPDVCGFFDSPSPLELALRRQADVLLTRFSRRVDAFLLAEAARRGMSIEQLAGRYALCCDEVFESPGSITTRWWLEPIAPPPPA